MMIPYGLSFGEHRQGNMELEDDDWLDIKAREARPKVTMFSTFIFVVLIFVHYFCCILKTAFAFPFAFLKFSIIIACFSLS